MKYVELSQALKAFNKSLTLFDRYIMPDSFFVGLVKHIVSKAKDPADLVNSEHVKHLLDTIDTYPADQGTPEAQLQNAVRNMSSDPFDQPIRLRNALKLTHSDPAPLRKVVVVANTSALYRSTPSQLTSSKPIEIKNSWDRVQKLNAATASSLDPYHRVKDCQFEFDDELTDSSEDDYFASTPSPK